MNKLKKTILSVLVVISTTYLSSIYAFAAKSTNDAGFDLSGGIKKITDQVTVEFKDLFTIICGVLTIVALIFGVIKSIKAFLNYRKGQDYEVISPILCFVAAVVAAICSAGSFFGWFGV